MATMTSNLHGTVSSAHRFDESALLRYATANVKGFPDAPRSFVVSQFGHGQSNPTFLLEVFQATGAIPGAVSKRYVLRKKPSGVLLESAHAVEREFQVLKALGDLTDVPVPKVFSLCNDPTVIGTPFYIMEYLEGRIFMDNKLPGVAPKTRTAIYEASAKALASLHSVNVDAIGLERFGRRENYCRRQVERWERQYLSSTGEGKPDRNPKMLELASWLKNHIPSEDSSRTAATGLVHGDFRIDNLVFHPVEDRVIGILDWELSTLGNQMCDVAYSSLAYYANLKLFEDGPYEGFELTGRPEGIPSLPEYLAEYCLASGKPWPASDWKFYVAFSMFRGVSIYAGVYHRWTMGNASGGERAERTGRLANILIDFSWVVINAQSLLPNEPPVGLPLGEGYGFLDVVKDRKLLRDLLLYGREQVCNDEKLERIGKLRKYIGEIFDVEEGKLQRKITSNKGVGAAVPVFVNFCGRQNSVRVYKSGYASSWRNQEVGKKGTRALSP